MLAITEELLRSTLSQVRYPGFSRVIVSFCLLKEVRSEGREGVVQMQISTADPAVPQAIKRDSEAALRALSGVSNVQVRIDVQAPTQAPAGGGATAIPGIKHIVAVASGKGGVGK